MRFNFIKRGSSTTKNYEGAKAFRMSPEFELYTAVVTSSVSETIYATFKRYVADQTNATALEVVGKLHAASDLYATFTSMAEAGRVAQNRVELFA